VQRFVDADFSEHYFTLLNEPLHHPQLRRIAAFDLLLNNGDRKGGHLIIDAEQRIWGSTTACASTSRESSGQ